MTIRIIQAKAEDGAVIANVHVPSWHAAYEKIVPASVLAAQSVEKQEAFWRDALNKNPCGVLVAVAPANEIVGFVSFRPCRTHNAIGEIAEKGAGEL
jgi:L-amino acid N-acyltransferase YncA